MSMPTASSAARPPLLTLLILLTLVTIGVALWYLTSYSLRGGGDVRWHPVAGPCELERAPCWAPLSQGRLSFAIGVDDEIRALEMLPLEVRLEGLEAEVVVVTFVGRDMDMGLHRFPMTARGDGTFHGLGQVPICTEAVMAWRAEVTVVTAAGREGSRFDFSVERSRL